MSAELNIDPPCAAWPGLLARRPSGSLAGQSLEHWRTVSRRELGLSAEQPILATGHQTLLWHPGILAKYLVVDAFAAARKVATANLIVDQHAEGFGEFAAPVRRGDGALAMRRVELCRPRPRQEVPMGRHEAFTPPRPPSDLNGALSSVDQGVERIFDAVYARRNAPNAALQMADALADLMKPWVRPMPHVTSTALIGTSLARALMREMAADPHRCAECYNQAVAALPQAGIGPLLIRDDYIELPLWRIRPDGRRMHAYDGDVAILLNDESKIQNPKSKIDLLPRALLMTALVRLCMCDLFVHGTGGAIYDRAMELWIRAWLGLEVASIAVVTATVRLPLLAESQEAPVPSPAEAIAEERRLWHDPEPSRSNVGRAGPGPGRLKRSALASIESAPRNSMQRRSAFLQMHDQLNQWRAVNGSIEEARKQVDRAKRHATDVAIAQRRDWAFPLHPHETIDDLARAAAREAAIDQRLSANRG